MTRPELEQAVEEFIRATRRGETASPGVLLVVRKVLERFVDAGPEDTWDDLVDDVLKDEDL